VREASAFCAPQYKKTMLIQWIRMKFHLMEFTASRVRRRVLRCEAGRTTSSTTQTVD
jgi:hypothetical protein